MWQKLFQAMMQTEQAVLPIFIHNPQTQKIVGAIVVAEEIFGTAFTPANSGAGVAQSTKP